MPIPAMMPKRRRLGPVWVYVEPKGPRPDRIDLTYWMNSLQPIPQDDPLFVTLNANRPIREELIHDEVTFRHPVYDLAAQSARAKALQAMNGIMQRGFAARGCATAFTKMALPVPSMWSMACALRNLAAVA